jgi:hypothetical protein
MHGEKAPTVRRAITTAAAALMLVGGAALGAANTATADTVHAAPGVGAVRAAVPAGGLTLGQVIGGSTMTATYIRIQSLYATTPGQCLDADATNGGNGTKVQAWACNGSDQQEWRSWGDYSVESVKFPGMCLDADTNGAGNNGTKVQLWQCNSTSQQEWFMRNNDLAIYNGAFNNNLNTVLDRDTRWQGDGAPAQLWQKNFQSQQWWQIVAG